MDISTNFSGLELAELILNIEPKLFIVFQTAYEEYTLDVLKGGMGYLLKPFEDIELKKTLQKNIFYIKRKKVNIQKKF